MNDEIAEDLFRFSLFEGWEIVDEDESYYKHSLVTSTYYVKMVGEEVYYAVYGTRDYDWGSEYEGYYRVYPKEITKTVWTTEA